MNNTQCMIKTSTSYSNRCFYVKMVELKKKLNPYAEAPPEKQTPLIDQTFNNCSATTYFFLNRSPSNSKTGGTENEA